MLIDFPKSLKVMKGISLFYSFGMLIGSRIGFLDA